MRHHVDIPDRAKLEEALKGKPDQRFADAQYVEELFGLGGTAGWPKAAADATCHNGYVIMLIHGRVQRNQSFFEG